MHSNPGGTLRDDYLKRLEHVLDEADELGMVPILVYFDFGQEQRLRDEEAVRHGVQEVTYWLLRKGYRNVLVVINNECDGSQYHHSILKAERLPELIKQVKSMSMEGRHLWVGSSFAAQTPPQGKVVGVSDFLLLRSNGVRGPEEITKQARQMPEYHPMPLFCSTEGTSGDGELIDLMLEAFRARASWVAFDPGKSDYISGFLCPPVNWSINTERKKTLFGALKEVTGE